MLWIISLYVSIISLCFSIYNTILYRLLSYKISRVFSVLWYRLFIYNVICAIFFNNRIFIRYMRMLGGIYRILGLLRNILICFWKRLFPLFLLFIKFIHSYFFWFFHLFCFESIFFFFHFLIMLNLLSYRLFNSFFLHILFTEPFMKLDFSNNDILLAEFTLPSPTSTNIHVLNKFTFFDLNVTIIACFGWLWFHWTIILMIK